MRYCLWICFATLAAMTLGAPGAEAQDGDGGGESASAERPNVLFIAIDDLNDWVTHLGGHPQARTPHLDALAERGMTFTRAYCNSPICNPSRSALLTGIPPHESGVLSNGDRWRQRSPNVVTLPAQFRAHGYHTLGSGKIFHHGGNMNDDGAWHEYHDWRGVPNHNYNGLRSNHFDWGPRGTVEDQPDHDAVSWAIEKLQHNYDEPLFLAVGIYRPHLPWYAPQEYFDRFPLEEIQLPEVSEDDIDDLPPSGLSFAHQRNIHRSVTEANQWERAVQAYLASIAFADDELGRLMEAFDASSIADNTIIVLWSDHGWHLGEKEHWRKFTLWDEACRVPMAFVVPGVTNASSECERTVSLQNIYPTLCDLCELPKPDHVADHSIRPLLADPQTEWDHPVISTYLQGNHSVRTERWCYIRYRNGDEELYDHDADPNEWNNLAGDPEYAEVIEELRPHLPSRRR